MNVEVSKCWQDLGRALYVYVADGCESGENSYSIDALEEIPNEPSKFELDTWDDLSQKVREDPEGFQLECGERALYVRLAVLRLQDALHAVNGERRLPRSARVVWGLMCDTSRIHENRKTSLSKKWKTLLSAFTLLGEKTSDLKTIFDRSQFDCSLTEPSSYLVARLIFELAQSFAEISEEKGSKAHFSNEHTNKSKFFYALQHPKPEYRDLAVGINKADHNSADLRSQNQVAYELFPKLPREDARRMLQVIRKYERDKKQKRLKQKNVRANIEHERD